MSLLDLSVTYFRNINHAELAFEPGLNVIDGANGSGKTSLLEAVYLLSRGKSFRTRYTRQMVQHGSAGFQVVGRLVGRSATSAPFVVGVEYRDQATTIRAGGESVKRASQLALELPLCFISAETARMMNQGPGERRKYLDWGLFHVEPHYWDVHQRYSRVIKQRNMAMRMPAGSPYVWNRELASAGEQLHEMRLRYLGALEPTFVAYLGRLMSGASQMEVRLHYTKGWSRESLAESLVAQAESDREMGFTQSGPHRADLVVKMEGRASQEFASAGQQKLVVCALYLAQLSLMREQQPDKACLVLVDDLPAELDEAHRATFLTELLRFNAQILVTTTERELVIRNALERPSRTFHVEQGAITTV